MVLAWFFGGDDMNKGKAQRYGILPSLFLLLMLLTACPGPPGSPPPGEVADEPPTIEITSPANGASFPRGSISVPFSAEVSDPEGESVSVTWTSNLHDDPIAVDTTFFGHNALAFGTHLITAMATDAAGNTASDTISITITNDPPEITILQPAEDAGPFCAGDEEVTFSAVVTDLNSPPHYTLPDESVEWRVEGESAFATGKEVRHTFAAPGEYIITARATDERGLTAEASIPVSVEACTNFPPTVSITEPPADTGPTDPDFAYDGFDEEKGMWYTDLTLNGTATDPEDGVLTGDSLVWITDRSDLQAPELGTGSTINARLYSNTCQGTWHEITLTARDSAGNERPATRRIRIWTLC